MRSQISSQAPRLGAHRCGPSLARAVFRAVLISAALLPAPARASDQVAVAGRKFSLIAPDHSRNARSEKQGAEEFVRLEVQPGDRPPGDNPAVDRIGYDGWPDPLPATGEHVIRFSLVPGPGSLARRPGDWWNFFELHAVPADPQELKPAGPLRMTLEWSARHRETRLRVWRQTPLEKDGRLTGTEQTMLYDGDGRQEGRRLDFIVAVRNDPVAGSVRIDLNGRRIVDYGGAFGYGGRRLYPQFRIYRNHRDYPASALFRIEDISTRP